MTRAEKVAKAQRLRAEGLTIVQIAQRMGASRSAVSMWLCDPDLSRQRANRERYGGTCIDCGARTDGSNGRAAAPTRCLRCRSRYQHENARWTRDVIIEAIQRFAREHGRPPTATDWRRSGGADHPNTTVILHVFGRWADAIEAAGFPRPRVGYYERRAKVAA